MAQALPQYLRAFIAIVSCLMVVGCQRQPTYVTELAPISQIDAPSGNYRQIAWLSDSQLIVQYEVDGAAWDFTNLLWSLALDDGELHALDLPKPAGVRCTSLFFTYPTAMPDGRLAFERHCHKAGADFFDIYLMYWDPVSGKSDLLYQNELPKSGPYTFAPDLSRGLLSSSNRIEDRLYWLDTNGYSVIDIDFARASNPAWSPNQSLVAFFGNQKLKGPAGPGWATQPTELWMMPTDCETIADGCAGALKQVVSDITRFTTLQWSPDGQWLVFSGGVNGSDQGVWLLNPSTTLLIQVAVGDYSMPTWSPDGSQIAFLGPDVQVSSSSDRTTLYKLEVGTIVAEAAPNP